MLTKERKRRYKEGDYGHGRWPRGKPFYRVAVAVEPWEPSPTESERPLRFWFRVPEPQLVTMIFDKLKGSLFENYSIKEDIHPCIINGKCYQSWVVTVRKPDLHRLSIPEWPTIIKSMMERRFRVRVTCFDKFEKFLNA